MTVRMSHAQADALRSIAGTGAVGSATRPAHDPSAKALERLGYVERKLARNPVTRQVREAWVATSKGRSFLGH